MKYKLLASAPTRERIEEIINKFHFTTNLRVMDSGEIRNVKTGKTLEGVRVIEKKGRYRFEMEEK